MSRIFIAFLLANAWLDGYAQSSLPPCKGSPFKDTQAPCFGSHEFAPGYLYLGDWRDGKMNGWGSLTFPDGAKNIGEFKDGMLDGWGESIAADGAVINSGIWKRGRFDHFAPKPRRNNDSGKPDAPSAEDSVARRLALAAEQEKDPELRVALWREYRQYVTSRQQSLRDEERRQRDALEAQQELQKREEQRQLALQSEQHRLRQEREQIYWACVSRCSANPGATLLLCMSRCKASSNKVTDYDWDWDEFYDQYGTLVWRCRGVQTGQYSENSNCAYDAMTDRRWPEK